MIQWNAPITDQFRLLSNVERNAQDDAVDPTWPHHYTTSSGLPELGQDDLPLQPYY
jgi:hypothetical protein